MFSGEITFMLGGCVFLWMGLSIVAFVRDVRGLITLGLGLSLVTLGAGWVSWGGLDVSLKVTCPLSGVVLDCADVIFIGTLLSSSSIFCNASICSVPFLFFYLFQCLAQVIECFNNCVFWL
jgi:hypothetical protein